MKDKVTIRAAAAAIGRDLSRVYAWVREERLRVWENDEGVRYVSLSEIKELEALMFKRRNNRTYGAGVVYYIRFADRVKIGTSTNIAQRLKAIYHDELMATEPGGPGLEAQRHREFAEYLVPGQREWFFLTPEVKSHIDGVLERFGKPMTTRR